jgi:hypothetical protein
MLDLVKGKANVAHGDEGYVSWFMDRPAALFARVLPPQTPLRRLEAFRDAPELRAFPTRYDGLLPNVIPVRMDTFENLPIWREYVMCRWASPVDQAARLGVLSYKGAKQIRPKKKKPPPLPDAKKQSKKKQPPPLDAVGGVKKQPKKKQQQTAAADARPATCDAATAAALEHVIQGRATPHHYDLAALTLDQALAVAPKLAEIARSVKRIPLKTLVLIHARNGPDTLVRLLQQLLGKERVRALVRPEGTTETLASQRRANKQNLAAFNQDSNRDGDEVQVIVATAEEWSEGANFMYVRRVVLADLSPGNERPSWSIIKQRIGRALRSCSHHALDPVLRTLRVDLYVTVHGHPDYEMTHDARKLLDLLEEIPRVEEAMETLARLSFDATLYGQRAPATPRRRWLGL